jgi:hypothetical protein
VQSLWCGFRKEKMRNSDRNGRPRNTRTNSKFTPTNCGCLVKKLRVWRYSSADDTYFPSLSSMSNLGLRFSSSRASRASVVSPFKSHWGTRNLHKRRALLYPIEDGLGEFLPPAALKAVAEEYHDGLLRRLNEETQGESREPSGKPVFAHISQERSNRASVSFRL